MGLKRVGLVDAEFTDRYQAIGIPYPDPKTCCDECDGMGCYPVHRDYGESNEVDRALWEEQDKRLRNFKGFVGQL